jgi:hypothetical protein
MDVYPIQNEPIPANTYQIAPAGPQKGNGGKNVREIGDLPGKDSLSQNSSIWAELQKINESLNEAAQKHQTRGKILKGLESYVERLKAQLERIIKNFPPYPPGSEDRIALLRGYVGFRKLIDELTIPPPEDPAVVAETSKVLIPADAVPGASQPGEMVPENLQA